MLILGHIGSRYLDNGSADFGKDNSSASLAVAQAIKNDSENGTQVALHRLRPIT